MFEMMMLDRAIPVTGVEFSEDGSSKKKPVNSFGSDEFWIFFSLE